LLAGAGGAVPEVPTATQMSNGQISEVGFETVDFSGHFSNFVSKIETSRPKLIYTNGLE
jgi:hypothetical protein